MLERVDELEVKVGRLIDCARQMRNDILRLRKENQNLKEDLDTKGNVVKQNSELQSEAQKLREQLRASQAKAGALEEQAKALNEQLNAARGESETMRGQTANLHEQMDGFASKENVVRNKLKTILDRVEDIEKEISQLEGSGSG